MWWLRECWRILHRWNLAMQLLPWMANAVAGFSASLEQRNHHGSIELTMAATQFCQVCTMLTSGADQLLEQVSKGTSAWTVLLATKLTKLTKCFAAPPHLHTSTCQESSNSGLSGNVCLTCELVACEITRAEQSSFLILIQLKCVLFLKGRST